jgi:hypothetical protein
MPMESAPTLRLADVSPLSLHFSSWLRRLRWRLRSNLVMCRDFLVIRFRTRFFVDLVEGFVEKLLLLFILESNLLGDFNKLMGCSLRCSKGPVLLYDMRKRAVLSVSVVQRAFP